MIKNYIIITLFTLLQWILTYVLSLNHLIISSLILLFITCVSNLENPEFITFIFISGFLGLLFDLLLNVYSRIFNSIPLKSYFNKVGPVVSSMFAFCATAWMIMDTWMISESASLYYENIKDGALILLIGFAIGILWGAVGHYSKGMKQFKVFYDSTGFIQGRFWDGIALVPVLIILFLMKSY